MSDRRNVTGIWYGRWSSPHPFVPPGTFIATLAERGSVVSGSTTEPDHNGAGIVRASIDGARAGGRIEFIKQYDGPRLAHAVAYAGAINAAGTEISGTFRFALRGRSYSGSFVMTRETFTVEELEEDVVEEREVELTRYDASLPAAR